MSNQEFETPQDALAHYGKKGMRWGVINEDKPTGREPGAKPVEPSSEDISKAIDKSFAGNSKADINAEGKAKLKKQAASSFPTKGAEKQAKRDAKADDIESKADDVNRKLADLNAQRKALAPGVRTSFKRAQLTDQINAAEVTEKNLRKKADDVREGKLTRDQKIFIGVGAAVTVAGVALAVERTADARARKENIRATTKEWEALFGETHKFEGAGSVGLAQKGSFYAGFGNKKALSRPEFTIPQDTVFQRLSNHKEDSSEYGRVKGAYATFLNNDKKLYGATSEFAGSKYTITFRSKEPTKVPTIATTLAHLKVALVSEHPERASYYDANPDSIFGEYRQMSGGNWSDPVSRSMFSSLRSFGYGAIVDDMDAGYLGDLPVVFFGNAEPARSTPRGPQQIFEDASGVLHLSHRYS